MSYSFKCSIQKIQSVFLASLTAIVLAAGCSSAASTSPEDHVVRVCLQPIPSYAPLWIAKRKGWLREALHEAGLGSVEWSTMRDGPLQNEAFAAGMIDVALTADTPAIIGRSAGLDIEVVALAATSPESLAILIPADSQVKGVADLKGKKIAATKGSFCHHLLALALQKEGLSLDDVRFINMSGPEINTSLQTGNIDAGVTWEPYITQILSSGSAKILLDGTNLKSGNEVIVVTRDLAQQSPNVVQKILEVFRKGHDYLRENPEDAAKLIATDVDLQPEQLVTAFQKIKYITPLDDATLAEFDATQKFLHELGVNRRTIDVAEFIDFQFQPDATLKVK
ncbi:aliphatic sulfonate ABC transporter substrate-binding protein [Bremerella alba]|uniref:Putative aliphatic sulfonates-binding protein n=1 Tax=Bremerella alba TaxID=980252 RepID=A0A7V9A563_9BACT|nr:aliphatic sulfonate ABC transporter substrate-binding protein [Bremerella alba]MBA2112877.1 putative aliphatic sulfonates-binding protein [Bremerella alba]